MAKVLIISYTFPPNEGVGGRRWAKFAKYLYRSGHSIKIITDVCISRDSNWSNDIKEYEKCIERINFNYPISLTKRPRSFRQKISYRISLMYVKIFSKGNYYDRSIFVKNKLLSKVEQNIREGYNNIIVTMAPFHLGSVIADLKLKYPDVNFIADFRDPWIFNKSAYGFFSLSPQRQEYEVRSEKKVVSGFDKIVSVSDYMSEAFQLRYVGEDRSKFITIENGYDSDDYVDIKVSTRKDISIVRFVFIGTFYKGASQYIDLLCEQLTSLKLLNKDLYDKTNFDFYGQHDLNVNSIQNLHQNVRFHSSIPIQKAVTILSEATVGMLFLTDDINYSFSTKFCEYLANNLPIVVFGKKGRTAEFVENHKIGCSIDFNDPPDRLLTFITQIRTHQLHMDILDKKEFDVERISKRIESLLI